MSEAAFYNLRVIIRKIYISFVLIILMAILIDLITGYSIKGQIVEKNFVRLYIVLFFLNGCFSNFKKVSFQIIEGVLLTFIFLTICLFYLGEIMLGSYYEDKKYGVRSGLYKVQFVEKTNLFEKRLGYLEFRPSESDIHKGLGQIIYYDKKTIKFSYEEARIVP